MRERRRGVSPAERRDAAERVARHADRAFRLGAGQRIALYSALPEELDTTPLLELASARRCEVFLPHIDDYRSARLSFRRQSATVKRNRFGILEPADSEALPARWFDLIFLPLVAFDAQGTRLGMGGGYYDRALGWRHARRSWRGPRLVGLAYAFQQVPAVPAAPHDVHLDAVVTENGKLRCSTG